MNKRMYDVIIFGTGVSSQLVMNVLNDSCRIIAFLDNNPRALGTKNAVPVLCPDKINNIKYDFIVIGSQYNQEIYKQLISLNVEKTKILQFYKVLDSEFDYIENAINMFRSSKIQYEMLATGISYCYVGLRAELMKKRCFTFAFGSQDIYYDYNIIKYILKNYPNKTNSLRYCLIGLNYYTFQYDMSLSSMKNKVMLYYKNIGLLHNNFEISNHYEEYLISKNIADKIFRIGKDGKYDYDWVVEKLPIEKSMEELGKEQAERDCDKNYPRTVEENRRILREYIELLKNNGIKPIIVIFPASKYYTKYFSKRIENEFKSIISELMKEHRLQYIDYFRSELFVDDDFADVSHLSFSGAEKFTRILNDIIEW